MKQWWSRTIISVGMLFVMVEQVPAQIGTYVRPQVGRPTISPYLNLMRSGNPAINYYGIVRPQIETYQNLQQMQGEIQQIQNFPLQGQANAQMNLPMTGHAATFMNYSHYFGAYGTRGGTAGMPTGYRSASAPIGVTGGITTPIFGR